MNKRKVDNVFNINKAIGMTSNDCLSLFKRITKIKKCGFAGTLDPLADGVLPVACGKETKNIENIINEGKEYVCEVEFGKETTTGDIAGEVTNQVTTDNILPSVVQIEECIKKFFLGKIMQSPHIYSATKVNGVRMCDLARNGVSLNELQEIANNKAKEIIISNIEIVKIVDSNHIIFRVECGRGTYIRQLFVDIARKLNTFAFITKLTRTKVGTFDITDSYNLNDSNSVLKLLDIIKCFD